MYYTSKHTCLSPSQLSPSSLTQEGMSWSLEFTDLPLPYTGSCCFFFLFGPQDRMVAPGSQVFFGLVYKAKKKKKSQDRSFWSCYIDSSPTPSEVPPLTLTFKDASVQPYLTQGHTAHVRVLISPAALGSLCFAKADPITPMSFYH